MTPRRILAAVWDFLVGDDPRLALAAVLAIGITAIVAALGGSAWWAAPLIALGALWWTLRGVAPHTPVLDQETSVRRSGEDGGRGRSADTAG